MLPETRGDVGNSPVHGLIGRALGWFLRLLYTRLAWAYDLVAWLVSAGAWQRWARGILPWIEGKHVLELGSGPGHLQAGLQAQPRRIVYGLDLSRQMLRLAARKLDQASVPNRLVRANAECMPYASSHFDCAFATFPAPYIFSSKTIQEIHRVLRPGGRLVVLLAARPARSQPFAWLANAALSLVNPRKEDSTLSDRILELFRQESFDADLDWKTTPDGSFWLLLCHKT